MGFFEKIVVAIGMGREAEKLPEDKTWKLGDGVRIVVNPTVMCPWCEEDVETRRIWVVNEEVGKVLMAAEIGTGVKDSEYRLHPHVGSSQMICMGNAGSVGEALWGKVNLDSVFWKPGEWFRDMGHACEGMWEDEESEIYFCEDCGEGFEDEGDLTFCPESGQSLCQDCWDARRAFCQRHDEYVYVGLGRSLYEVLTEKGIEDWCEDCSLDYGHTCPGCDRLVDDDALGEWQDHCGECFNHLFTGCWECSKSTLIEEMAPGEDGLWRCEGCLGQVIEEEKESEEELV